MVEAVESSINMVGSCRRLNVYRMLRPLQHSLGEENHGSSIHLSQGHAASRKRGAEPHRKWRSFTTTLLL